MSDLSLKREVMTLFETLKQLGLSSDSTREIYSEKSRDKSSLTVYKDNRSGIIFIDDYYTGDDTYVDGSYRRKDMLILLKLRKIVVVGKIPIENSIMVTRF